MSARNPILIVHLVALIAACTASGARAEPGSQPGSADAETESPVSWLHAPYHGHRGGIVFGGHGDVHFRHDRVRGVSDPEWFSVGRMNAFTRARIHPRVELGGQLAAWDEGTHDLVVERAELQVRMGRSLHAHAGIFLTPLGRTNLEHDAPRNEFTEYSLVATEIVGVPSAQLGAGIRGVGRAGNGWPLSYELDLVTGYDDGLITESAGGTRVPQGRNNYGDNNGIPALAARLAVHPSPETEIGLAGQSGQYNTTNLGGMQVDHRRYAHVVVTDAETRKAGFRIASEAALAIVDVPPGLAGLYAERQWGASIEIGRTLREPIHRAWGHSAVTVAVRADCVDLDQAIAGDSRSRLSASLNVHQRPFAVTRLGWYYEIRRDRFNNETPLAGVVVSAASYF